MRCVKDCDVVVRLCIQAPVTLCPVCQRRTQNRRRTLRRSRGDKQQRSLLTADSESSALFLRSPLERTTSEPEISEARRADSPTSPHQSDWPIGCTQLDTTETPWALNP